jgi:hypothetical protein
VNGPALAGPFTGGSAIAASARDPASLSPRHGNPVGAAAVGSPNQLRAFTNSTISGR